MYSLVGKFETRYMLDLSLWTFYLSEVKLYETSAHH